MALRCGLVYNLKRDPRILSLPEDYFSECDSDRTVSSIAHTLHACGFEVVLHEFDKDVVPWLLEANVDFIFNIAEGFSGTSREAQAPALFDFLRIPYTGSGVTTMAVCLDKAMTKRILIEAGIPTPRFQLFFDPGEPLDATLRFPLIVKPNREGSAKGITVASVVRDETRLRVQIRAAFESYGEEVLVEEFIEGRELTVGLLGNGDALQVLPILEIDFASCKKSGEYFYTWRMKEFQGDETLGLTPRFLCPAPLDPQVRAHIEAIARDAYKIFNCFDFARFDVRLDRRGIPYIIELNPLPGLDPEESNFPMMGRAQGLSYVELLGGIAGAALKRHQETLGETNVHIHA